jgi:DNA-binding beta-propeller fold protein YncE
LLLAPAWIGPPSRADAVLVERFGGFNSPTRVALLTSGELYVTDHDRGTVAILERTGKRIGTIAGLGAPLGLAVYEPSVSDPGKKRPKIKKRDPPQDVDPPRVYVGDETDGSVRIFVGRTAVGFLGQGSGEFRQPNAIATMKDASGNLRVYVVDSKANQIRVYDDQGGLLLTFGTSGTAPGELMHPSDIVISEGLGKVYVSDFGNERLSVFDLDGAPLPPIPAPRNDRGDPVFFRPAGLGIDPDGNLYVVDNGLSCVAILDPYGALLDVIGYAGGEYWTGELELPLDAATDGERIYVTSNRQRQLVVFEVTP